MFSAWWWAIATNTFCHAILFAALYQFRFSPTLEGLYTCVATQHILDKKVGEVYSDVVLVETLAEAPIVTQKPDSHISLCEGSPILLKVKASAYPIPTYEWTHENEVLTTETNNFLYVIFYFAAYSVNCGASFREQNQRRKTEAFTSVT